MKSLVEYFRNMQHRVKRGGYQCFHCGAYAVSWDSDFDFEDYGLDGEGVINCCHCSNCGAEIEYYVRLDEDEEQ